MLGKLGGLLGESSRSAPRAFDQFAAAAHKSVGFLVTGTLADEEIGLAHGSFTEQPSCLTFSWKGWSRQ